LLQQALACVLPLFAKSSGFTLLADALSDGVTGNAQPKQKTT